MEPTMLRSPHWTDLGSDLALIAKAIVDAFRGLSARAKLESRWSKLRHCGESF